MIDQIHMDAARRTLDMYSIDVMEDLKQEPLTFGLSFKTLREANLTRHSMFNNTNDWRPEDWLVAILGELGDAASILKKVRRSDFTMDTARDGLARQFADTVIYLDLFVLQFAEPLWRHDFVTLRLHARRNIPDTRSFNTLMAQTFYHVGTLIQTVNLPNEAEFRGRNLALAKLVTGAHYVLYYVDRLAEVCGVDLEEAVKTTFNLKSQQLDLPLFLTDGGPIREIPT